MSGAYKTTWHRVHIEPCWLVSLLPLNMKVEIYVNPNTEALWQRIFVLVCDHLYCFGETQYSKMKEIAMCNFFFFFFFEFSYSIGLYWQMVRMACLKTWKFRIACCASSTFLPSLPVCSLLPTAGFCCVWNHGDQRGTPHLRELPGVGFRALDRELIGGT